MIEPTEGGAALFFYLLQGAILALSATVMPGPYQSTTGLMAGHGGEIKKLFFGIIFPQGPCAPVFRSDQDRLGRKFNTL